MIDNKTCTNCEGEGRVCRWGFYGHEVPASRRRNYPNDKPTFARDLDGEPFECVECSGSGVICYDHNGNRVRKVKL